MPATLTPPSALLTSNPLPPAQVGRLWVYALDSNNLLSGTFPAYSLGNEPGSPLLIFGQGNPCWQSGSGYGITFPAQNLTGSVIPLGSLFIRTDGDQNKGCLYVYTAVTGGGVNPNPTWVQCTVALANAPYL